jgi:PAS domain S-box-containing protein
VVRRSVAAGPSDVLYEAVGLRKDGSTFPGEVCGKVIPYEGRTVRVSAVRDITERKQADEALRRAHQGLELRVRERTAELSAANAELTREIAERRRAEEELVYERYLLHSLMDRLPDVIYFKDAASRFLRVNRALSERWGLGDPAEALGKTDFDQFAEEHARQAFEDEQEIIRTGRPLVDKEEKETWADGRVTWVSSTKMPLRDAEGRVIGTFGISRDITARKQAEVELQAAKEAAEAASRAKSEFLANMSHEIRTPMNGILGMTELALGTDLTAEQRDYLEMVKSSAGSLLAVLNDVLDFSKIEARKLQLEAVPFGLRDVLGGTLKGLGVRAGQKGLELTWHVLPGVPDALVGDPGRLRQVVVNLVGNAVKFTEAGEVVVTVQRTEDRGQRTEDRGAIPSSLSSVLCPLSSCLLHFAVADTGIGIPADKQGLIFEAFAQAYSSTTRKYGGTGLGLTIASHLVEMMGGRIWVESEVGKGSSFHFTLGFGLADRPAEEPPADLRGLPVLVVDDCAASRRGLGDVLAEWGWRPVLHESAGPALAELRQAAAAGEPFPLLLLDAHMPGMDGFALAEEVRRDPVLAGTALVMLTAAGQPGDVVRCRELGLGSYLMKPVTPAELLDALRAALRGPPRDARPPGPEPPPTRRRLRVLLTEDNPVNQKVAVRLLEKQGHAVVVAGNGREALAALGRQAFDLVLMDVQMPEMDGLEATALIRRQEQGSGRHVPVVAMTAHAMKGDRERCLAAGMDGYVAKPVQVEDLFQTIAAVMPGSGDAAEAGPPAGEPAGRVIDGAALARVSGSADFLAEIVGLFLDSECPRRMEEIRDAVARRDEGRLRRAAHALKGTVGNLRAAAAFEAALGLENLARGGDWAAIDGAYHALEQEIERLKPALAQLVQGCAAP